MAKKTTTEKLRQELHHLPFLARVHALFRIKSFPFAAVLPHVPHQGPVVDYGAGFGLFSFLLATAFPRRQIIAYDIAQAKIAVAKKLLNNFPGLTVTQSFSIVKKSCAHPQVIILLDVLYLHSPLQKQKLLRNLFLYLRPGGVLVLGIVPKEFSLSYYLSWFQEWLMVHLFHLTQITSQTINFETKSWTIKTLHEAGFKHVTLHALPKMPPFFHQHLLLIAHKLPRPKSPRYSADGRKPE